MMSYCSRMSCQHQEVEYCAVSFTISVCVLQMYKGERVKGVF